tara:strand:- start:196 stop:990 length:795 start_codon:yes stop_codon:yes gene_type:complete
MSKAFDLAQLINDASKLGGGTIDNDRILLDLAEIPDISASKIVDLANAIDAQVNISKTFSVTAQPGQYIFSGVGTSFDVNPDLYLYRGSTYIFSINTSGHPFRINTSDAIGSGDEYAGITGQGTQSGTLVFTVPQDAPEVLHYNCEFHATMHGTIYIVAQGGSDHTHTSPTISSNLLSYEATAGQQIFDVAHKVGNVDVWYNGVYMISKITGSTNSASELIQGFDFKSLDDNSNTVNTVGASATKIQFESPLLADDYITIRSFN